MISAPSNPTLNLTVCTDPASRPELADQWNALLEDSAYPSIFRCWEWFESWWTWFGAGRPLHLALVRRGGELVAIAPWYVSWTRCGYVVPARTITLVGHGGPTYPEYLGPIVHRDHVEAAVPLLAEHLQSTGGWDAVVLPDIAPDDRATLALADALGRRFSSIRNPSDVCSYFMLPESYEAVLARLPAKRRQRNRARLRKAQKAFRVELRVIREAAELEAVYPAIGDLSQSARVRTGDESPFRNPQYAGFHREIIARLLPDARALVHVLSFDGRPAAFSYGYCYLNKFYGFQTGFDAALDAYSPGRVLFGLIFEDLIGRGVKEFDYLRGDHPYKQQFASGQRETETAYVFRRKGPAYSGHWTRTRVLRPLKRRLKQIA